MAKKKKQSGLSVDPADALAEMETPSIKWKAIAQILGAFAVLWVCALIAFPYTGYWGVGAIGVLSLVGVGFAFYVWRMTSKSKAIMDIMKGATSAEGRAEAIERLADEGGKDAMKDLARAQLLANTDPQQSLKVLEEINLSKAPAVVQDDIRSQMAMLYLRNNRVRDARALADDMRLDRQPNAKAKGLYAAVMAECFARTGSPNEARKLLETYDNSGAGSTDVQAMLLRAQVYTFHALKKRGLARKAMDRMIAIEPNLVAAFVQKGAQPDLAQLARQALAQAGIAPKMKVQHRL